MKIKTVTKDSVAYEVGIKCGDVLLGFNGDNSCDFLDYQYYNAQENFVMNIISGDELVDYEIEKYSYEDLGLEFDDELVIKRCRNKCIFCFVDQLPKKDTIRRTLLLKDDDYRLSTMCGNYVTLTNLSKDDIDRITKYKLSPMYVSVHSTDDQVRRQMLGNKKAEPILPIIKTLHDSGIVLHTQIVYCPTFNDDYIDTVYQLSNYCMSVAIVPVGLTNNSNKLLKPVTKEIARDLISNVERLQKEFKKNRGTNFVYVADELYIKAGLEIPPPNTYEHFYQTANGVGLIAQFDTEIKERLKSLEKNIASNNKRYTIVTGQAAYSYFLNLKQELQKYNISVSIKQVVNHYFGSSITVAGLVTASDIIISFENQKFDSDEVLLMPQSMLKQFENIFLDNITLEELAIKLGVKIEVVPVDGHALIEKLIS